MTDVTETTLYEKTPAGGIGYGFYTVTATAADTVTFDNFDTLIIAKCLKIEDNSEIALTPSGNQVTIGAGPAGDRLIIMLIGV